jgi:hypothetical protein
LIALVVSVAVNVVVDPLRVIASPWALRSLEPYRNLNQIRTGKAGLVRSHSDWQVVMCGSSRVLNALDPKLPGWEGKRVVNLGCAAGYLYESEAMCRYVLARQKGLELVVFGLDPGDLSSDYDTRSMADFYSSPLSDQDPISRELRYYCGISTFEASFDTVKRAVKKERGQYTPEGLRLGKFNQKPQQNQLGFIRREIAGGAEVGLPDGDGRVNDLRPAKVELLRNLLIDLHRSNKKVFLLYHPRHSLKHTHQADLNDLYVPMQKEIRALAALADEVNRMSDGAGKIEYWDFNDYHPLNCEALPRDEHARMEHWADLGHYSREMGNLILARMMGWPCPLPGGENYGSLVTPENVERHLATVESAYRRYLTIDGARDVAWKKQVILESSPPAR